MFTLDRASAHAFAALHRTVTGIAFVEILTRELDHIKMCLINADADKVQKLQGQALTLVLLLDAMEKSEDALKRLQ